MSSFAGPLIVIVLDLFQYFRIDVLADLLVLFLRSHINLFLEEIRDRLHLLIQLECEQFFGNSVSGGKFFIHQGYQIGVTAFLWVFLHLILAVLLIVISQ